MGKYYVTGQFVENYKGYMIYVFSPGIDRQDNWQSHQFVDDSIKRTWASFQIIPQPAKLAIHDRVNFYGLGYIKSIIDNELPVLDQKPDPSVIVNDPPTEEKKNMTKSLILIPLILVILIFYFFFKSMR